VISFCAGRILLPARTAADLPKFESRPIGTRAPLLPAATDFRAKVMQRSKPVRRRSRSLLVLCAWASILAGLKCKRPSSPRLSAERVAVTLALGPSPHVRVVRLRIVCARAPFVSARKTSVRCSVSPFPSYSEESMLARRCGMVWQSSIAIITRAACAIWTFAPDDLNGPGGAGWRETMEHLPILTPVGLRTLVRV